MGNKVTSKKVATEASKILQDDRYCKTSKSVAGSALSQRAPKRKWANERVFIGSRQKPYKWTYCIIKNFEKWLK